MRLVKPVEIELDRKRYLVENGNSYNAFEEETGKNALDPRTFQMPVHLILQAGFEAVQSEGPVDLDDLLIPDFEAMTVSTMTAWLWACLVDDDPALENEEGLRQVRRLVTPSNLNYIYDKLMELRRVSLPEPDEEKEPDAPGEAVSPSPGETSGPSGDTTSDSPIQTSGS
ncbi:MAG: hypothetical protein GEU73_04930 [Chloroflexi bacterium]|nr:hypothetical protein [Chloroflexota bacterium]